MTDVLTKEQRSYNMSHIRSKNTKPEILFRRYIYSKGLRGYRTHSKLPGKPDIDFSRYKVAIFIDGCFWHKCNKCYIPPKTNRGFWEHKINANLERDAKVNKELKKIGYIVIRIPEHEIKNNINFHFQRIYDTLKNRGFDNGSL